MIIILFTLNFFLVFFYFHFENKLLFSNRKIYYNLLIHNFLLFLKLLQEIINF